ncbi:MAG: LemA family protein [Pseudomonadales bacterium]
MSTLPSLLLTLIVAPAVLLGVYAIVIYNRLVALRNACANARAGIDVNLKRRHQLIPSLVAAVKGYTEHERETMTAVTASRTTAAAELGKPSSPTAEAALDTSMQQLTLRVEAYPDLKADASFINLMKNLTEAEEQISASRRAFNAQVMRMNNLVQQFPSLFVAQFAGFTTLLPFSAEAAVQQAPEIALSGGNNAG